MLGLNAVQLGMLSPQETAIEVQQRYPVIKEIVIEKTNDFTFINALLEDFAPHTAAFLIDFEKNNISWEDLKKGNPLTISQLEQLCSTFPILLSLPWSDAKVVEDVLSETEPQGITLKGGEEEKVGYKSFDELDDIFEALED